MAKNDLEPVIFLSPFPQAGITDVPPHPVYVGFVHSQGPSFMFSGLALCVSCGLFSPQSPALGSCGKTVFSFLPVSSPQLVLSERWPLYCCLSSCWLSAFTNLPLCPCPWPTPGLGNSCPQGSSGHTPPITAISQAEDCYTVVEI